LQRESRSLSGTCLSALRLNARNLTYARYEVAAEPANSPRHAICSVHGIITNRGAMIFGTDTARRRSRLVRSDGLLWHDLALGSGPRKCREGLDAI
ncbi:hypothetical protein, partial [Bradyrhizobium brasilense]|uniref:hypothetical protein n=1 Tax=Bradyrhizobium brasilense TaxID=1419277 RepID=UPI001E4569FF